MNLYPATDMQVTNLLDPWWIDQTLQRQLPEIVYGTWATDISVPSFETVDPNMPDCVQLLRRSVMTGAKKMNLVLEIGGALVSVEFVPRSIWVAAAAHQAELATAVIDLFKLHYPEPTQAEESRKVQVVLATQEGPLFQQIDVAPWDEISPNYPDQTRSALDGLMTAFRPTDSGRIILWHGPPGSGKTFALRSLLWEWRSWCSSVFVADAEAFLSDSRYMLAVMAGHYVRNRSEWQLVVLEDSGGLLLPTSRREGIARLLNTTDGVLGQGGKTLTLITTNELPNQLDEALSRPGRCASQVDFELLSPEQASAWLTKKGLSAKVERTATIAELFEAARDGSTKNLEKAEASVGFAAP